MANGISCAFFAARNHVNGQKEDNPFKKGIAGVQAARTIDAATKTCALSGPLLSPVSYFFNGIANIGKKIVYPLIIGSGIYNTVKSDDKVKTGASQASGITSMYLSEKVAEKALNAISKKLSTSERYINSKPLKVAWYIAKGLAFVASSLAGYSLGSKISDSVVDSVRKNKNSKIKQVESFPIEEGLKKSDIFAEMKL